MRSFIHFLVLGSFVFGSFFLGGLRSVWGDDATVAELGEETWRQATPLQELLLNADPDELASQARRRGDARRGALVFYKSAAACVTCHLSDGKESPLGPDLATIGAATDRYLVDALLRPSAKIREGFETYRVLTFDGRIINGLMVSQNDDQIVLRQASDLQTDLLIPREEIEAIAKDKTSMMPDGLMGSIGQQRDFLDLVRYVIEVAAGGKSVADRLRPSPEQLAVVDDTADLDHAGILSGLRSRDFEAGEAIYHGYCFNCHGSDGNTPSLPTARAFGSQPLRFGADPYRMFLTLSQGNGLMAAMTHLTPKERYQVVHYVREALMKPSNPVYEKIDDKYLASLPKGTRDGTEIEIVKRDYGPALASQLRREFSSALTIDLGDQSIAYDLHRMDQAGLWKGGFLDLSNTQHQRDRGEGTANPEGEIIPLLTGWRWAHQQNLDYPTDSLLPRGPLPRRWMDYHGHYLHGRQVVLSYSIDGREILESPQSTERGVSQTLRIGPGDSLLLSVAESPEDGEWNNVPRSLQQGTAAAKTDVVLKANTDTDLRRPIFVAAVTGEIEQLQWQTDRQGRVVLQIPASDKERTFTVWRCAVTDDAAVQETIKRIEKQRDRVAVNLSSLVKGGPELWPQIMHTTGMLGLQPGGYALDTLTLPDETPWNTWFRTSALDFFPDGRMVVTTYGGDVWIVSGVDQSLLDLRWKRFAAGLYEPFGVKVVDDQIYVTCKDRIVRLSDLNDNGEADFYESFSADTDVSVNFHAFNFDLQVDQEGNFYYAKSGHGADSDIPGAVFKISPDGNEREVYSTGFRTPNGMGMLPDGTPTVSDNQGQWTPASKINRLQPNGFYGWVPTYSIPGMWEPGGGSIDIGKVVPPDSFDPPLVWMPQAFDNSSGGQLWVDDPRWGPLSGHLLHTSFGKGWMSYLMMQQVQGQHQAAIIKLPYDFRTGIMRGRVNPADGQVYATGLQGWNGGGRIGLLDSGIQRLRYTDLPHPIVSDCQVTDRGLLIRFNFEVDQEVAKQVARYQGQQWNYQWSRAYGSDRYHPATGEVGVEPLQIKDVEITPDGKSVHLIVKNRAAVDQLQLRLNIRTAEGQDFREEIYWTINALPNAP